MKLDENCNAIIVPSGKDVKDLLPQKPRVSYPCELRCGQTRPNRTLSLRG